MSFGSQTNEWFLERDGALLATTAGLESGPVVEAVPEPTSVLGLLTVGALGVTSVLKKKQASS
ncbi:MAG: PEP-CTERM sorting domain-containing protein [Coleofasciculus sp.]|uniref:PEP-CTERM sorting domain-containing protein n=1 Tax=Coleofasciculus sp. TaxID=3100458 RepID=UPI003A1E943E